MLMISPLPSALAEEQIPRCVPWLSNSKGVQEPLERVRAAGLDVNPFLLHIERLLGYR